MRISEKRRMAIYSAIADIVMDTRIKLGAPHRKTTMLRSDTIDDELYALVHKIWRKQAEILKIEP